VDILLASTVVANLQQTQRVHATVEDTHLGVQMVAGSILEIRKSQVESEERASSREQSTMQHLQELAAMFQEKLETATTQIAQNVQAQTLKAVLQSLVETGLFAATNANPQRGIASTRIS